ncbi:hypothetical protein CANARDRAFT_180339, partial [[Candida] arabinofermentans NRRL YB-2248]
LNLKNSVTNYVIVFGTCKKFDDELPSIDINKLLTIDEFDELLYLIICLGACQLNEFNDAILMFNKSWEIIIDKISNSRINYNSGEVFNKFVENLIILSYIYLNYFINFSNSAKPDNEDLFKKISIPIDVLFKYLNNIISTHMNNTDGAAASSRNSSGNQVNQISATISSGKKLESFYWYAYLLLSHYSFIYNKSPSSLHLYLLNKQLPEDDIGDDPFKSSSSHHNLTDETLGQMINSLSVISTPFTNFVNHNTLTLKEQIIICGLMNELQMVKFNETNKMNKNIILQQGLFKDNKNFLHNAIILANKNFNVSEKVTINGDEEFVGLVTLIKRKLLINCPLKFTDLLTNYLILPKSNYNWILLSLTMKEFIFETESLINDKNFMNNDKPVVEFELSKFLRVNYLDSTSASGIPELTSEDIYKNIHNYIASPFNSNFIINNNLGITTLPMLMLSLNWQIVGSSNSMSNVNSNANNNANISEDEDMTDDDDDESIILAVIFYVINELGCNYDETSTLKDSANDQNVKKRANSISIGEFSNNNEKLKKMMSHSKESKNSSYHNSNKSEESIKSQIVNDYKFYFILKNLEKNFIGWLGLFEGDFSEVGTFIGSLEKVLNNEVYGKLNLFTNQPSSFSGNVNQLHSNIDVFNLISTQPSANAKLSNANQYQPTTPNKSTGFNSHDLFYLQQQHHEMYQHQSANTFKDQELLSNGAGINAGVSSNTAVNSRIMLPPLSSNSRQLPNPFRLPGGGGGAATTTTAVTGEGINELLQAASSSIDYDRK